MNIELSEKNGVKIIALSGKIMGTTEDKKFIEIIYDYAEQGHTKIVLDLSGVEWINSQGLGLCLRALTTLRKRNGDMKLANLSKNSRSLMERCRLLNVINHYKTIDKAVASFDK